MRLSFRILLVLSPKQSRQMAATFEAPATPTIVMLCGLIAERRSQLASPLCFKQVAFRNSVCLFLDRGDP